MDNLNSQQADMLVELINSCAVWHGETDETSVWHGETDETSTKELSTTNLETDVNNNSNGKAVSKDYLCSLTQSIDASLDKILADVTAYNQMSCQPLNFEGPQ